MKGDEVFGAVWLLSLRDDIDKPVARNVGGTGVFTWSRSVIHPLRRAMQRLKRMSLNNERLPHGWERGI